MKTKFSFLIISISILLFNSCISNMWVTGDGVYVQEIRPVDDFTKIASVGCYNVYFSYSDTSEVVINAESNLIPYIETFVDDGVLKICNVNNLCFSTNQSIEIYVKGPFVDEINLSGSGLIQTCDIIADEFDIALSGSGKIETSFVGKTIDAYVAGSGVVDLYAECIDVAVSISGSGKVNTEGEADYAQYKVAGSGNFSGYDFAVNNLEIYISGSGNMKVQALNSLDVNISGSGDVYYVGTPSIIQHISGSGHIYNRN